MLESSNRTFLVCSLSIVLLTSCSRTNLNDARPGGSTFPSQNEASPASTTMSPDSGTVPVTEALPKDDSFEVIVGDDTRQYRLYVPEVSREQTLPLLVMINGGGGNYYPFPQEKLFHDLAEREGFIVAQPISKLRPGNEGEWQLNTDSSSRQDIDFMERLIDDIDLSYSIDRKRVYATGYSLGSMFVYEIVCQLSTTFAAVASYAGTMPINHRDCEKPSPVGVMHIHGTEDPIISYFNTWEWKDWDSVGEMYDVPGLVQHWSDLFACRSQRQEEMKYVYENCGNNVRVEHFRLEGVGHEWPEYIAETQTANVMWSFLRQFSL